MTALGEPFGLSGIAVGRILADAGLRDPALKRPTDQALADGFARETPLASGVPHFMWNRGKVRFLFQDRERLPNVQVWANRVRRDLRHAEQLLAAGDDKLGFLWMDAVYDEVPADIREEVRRAVSGASPVEGGEDGADTR
jgi:hypothetical protein